MFKNMRNEFNYKRGKCKTSFHYDYNGDNPKRKLGFLSKMFNQMKYNSITL